MGKEWKSFPVDQIFSHKRGSRLIEEDQIPGETAYISSTKLNNGLNAFITPPESMKRHKNKITLANSGSVGSCFYHDYEFVASDHVTVIGIKDNRIELDANIALFLKPVFESMKYKYNFGREISDKRLSKEQIMLPASADGSPDWEYMRSCTINYRKSVIFNRIDTQNKALELTNFDGWKEFSLTEIFTTIESCKCSKAGDLIDGNDVYYLGAKKKDACVIKKVSTVPNLITRGNCIAFICDGDGSVGYANYIPFDEFIGTTNLSVGYYPEINKYNALFLVAVLDLQRSKYSFGRKYKRRLPATTIKLPAKGKKPNWRYMEEYIKALPYGDRI